MYPLRWWQWWTEDCLLTGPEPFRQLFLSFPLLSYCYSWVRAARQTPSSKSTCQTETCESTKRHLWRFYITENCKVNRLKQRLHVTSPQGLEKGDGGLSSRNPRNNHKALGKYSFYFITSQLFKCLQCRAIIFAVSFVYYCGDLL
jgi:hypothetical protein